MIQFFTSNWPDFSILVWGTAVLSVLLIGISKAGFGGGVGVIATPLLALTMPVADAAALLLPILIGADVFAVSHYKNQIDWGIIKTMLPSALAGIVLGTLFFNLFSRNESLIKVGIGVIAISFVLYQAFRTFILKSLESFKPSKVAGAILGVVSGFTSTLAHVGGPPFTIYLLPQNLPRNIFVGTTAVFFMILNVVKLIPYSWLGLIRVGNLIATLMLIPVAFIGVKLGVWMNKRVNQTVFNRIVYTFLLLTGIQLVLGQSILTLFWG